MVRHVAWVVVAWLLWVASAAAGPFSSIVVFGDSLSDVGNIASATLGVYPGSAYTDNRFSNGPVWVESLSVELGLGTLARSTAGGNNFAYGGAQTTGTGGFNGLFIRDIDEQVTQFLNSRSVDPTALFVVYAGANDLFNSATVMDVDVNLPVTSLMEDIGRLVAAGAKQLLLPNLPMLGETPSYLGNSTLVDRLNGRSVVFNDALDLALENLVAASGDLTLFRLDVAAIFAEAIAVPAAFGLTNATDSAAPGLAPGAGSYDTSQIVSNANEYLFWDGVHPTATVHAILAERALELLTSLPGDYNEDGTVNAADYTVWRNNFGGAAGSLANDIDGGVVGEAQYATWKSHFGASRSAGCSAIAADVVPEPAAAGLLISALVASSAWRRR